MKKIQSKILYPTLAAIAGVACILTATYVTLHGRSLEQQFESRGILITTSLASSGKNGVMMRDSALLSSYMDFALRDKDVRYILFFDEKGELLAERGKEYASLVKGGTLFSSEHETRISHRTSARGEHYLEVDAPIAMFNIIGSVKVGVATSAIAAEKRSMIILSAEITIASIIIVGLFILSVAKGITKPILMLSGTVHQVASGDLTARIDKIADDEVGRLALDMNRMVEKIRGLVEELDEKSIEADFRASEANRTKNIIIEQERSMTARVNTLLAAMDQFSGGNLAVRVKTEHDDELGRLFQGFNTAVEKIGTMIVKVMEAMESTAHAGNIIRDDTVRLTIEARNQSLKAAEANQAVERMVQTIAGTAANAVKAATLSVQYGEKAKEGGKTIIGSIDGMNTIHSVVTASTQSVIGLGESTMHIGEIIDVIDGIADQTNLLALNAAIEAARAGEQGRGFAVVADEVRKLAERTTNATKEITQTIKKIQAETSDVVEMMGAGSNEVEKGRLLTEHSGDSLEEIIQGAEQVARVVEDVATASREQTQIVRTIRSNIDTIASESKQTALHIASIEAEANELMMKTTELQDQLGQFTLCQDDTISELTSL